MAHLNRCHCGRTFRCEADHSPPPGVLRCMEEHCTKRCPDHGLPGHDWRHPMLPDVDHESKLPLIRNELVEVKPMDVPITRILGEDFFK